MSRSANGPLRRVDREKVVLGLAAPVLALVLALAVICLVMAATGDNAFRAFGIMADYGSKSDSQVHIINRAIPYYLSAAAVAIGFRMNLFNIGVEGQYLVAAFFAAAVGGALAWPGVIQIPLILLTAVFCGAVWSGIAGVLKATRGVSEVITTIMLNAVGTLLIAYFLQQGRLAEREENILQTPDIPDSSFFFEFPTTPVALHGTLVLAVAVGLAYWLVLGRTRFGFDLRAVGRSEPAAEASGVSVKRTVITAMVLSGAVAGLVGMPALLNDAGTYSNAFPAGFGFTGIAIALLGRNHPVGMALAALLWAFLEHTSIRLDREGFDQEIVGVMQGIIVLSVVIAYEVVRRWGLRRQQRLVGERLAGQARPSGSDDPAEVSA
ncbi:ABC transporter permease [Streptomyces sp. DSM 44917]|uniref:ABC transporter permease n=1 Tax=Streptomyces boetiae TaxID=3075541 RepID=A0ABU2L992_9ACTN|nr:ABC transporter permease [Streptomyces sp. DSM 44917]MDT0308147.1 ABC transporter permease [Streptomyces sp. DSM 44917]